MVEIVWPQTVVDALLKLPEKDFGLIIRKAEMLRRFPEMYPIRGRGRFRRCRWFLAGKWIMYYQVAGEKVFMRAVWPARSRSA
jgi:hypothetical protein